MMERSLIGLTTPSLDWLHFSGKFLRLHRRAREKLWMGYVSDIHSTLHSLSLNPQTFHHKIISVKEKISEKEVLIQTLKRKLYYMEYQKEGQQNEKKKLKDDISVERQQVSDMREAFENLKVSN